jgi:hypothetical protein
MQSRLHCGKSRKLNLRPALSLAVLALAALAVAPYLWAAPDEAVPGLPEPNWDRELAIQTAAMGSDEARLRSWFNLARAGERGQLILSVRAYGEAVTIAAPAREGQLFQFVQGLADFPPELVPGEVLDYLAARPVQTWVSHEESASSAVPLFNIKAAVEGVRNGMEVRRAEGRALELLTGMPGHGGDVEANRWIEAYLAGSGPERRGFLNALGSGTRQQTEWLAQTALQRARAHATENAALIAIAGRIAVAAPDREAFQQIMQSGRGPELASILRDSLAGLSLPDQALLLLFCLTSAPAENAALAIAVLAPGLQDNEGVTASLLDLLEDPALGASAALALAHYSDPGVRQDLKEIAAGEGPQSGRAQLALEISAEISTLGAAE